MPARKKSVLGRRSVASAQQTRERILNEAQKYFATVGYNEALNTKIATAAGITAAALYKHFKSKSEIYSAVCQRAEDQIGAINMAAIKNCVEPLDALNKMLDINLKEYRRDPSLQNFLSKVPIEVAHNPELALPLAEKISFKLQEQIIDLIKKGQSQGKITKAISAAGLSQMYVSSLMGIALSGARNGKEVFVESIKAFKLMLNAELFL